MSNRKNPAVKRILADVRELQTHPSSRYFAAPLEDNMFEWHFTIRGPADSAFADGIYHGRILLPTDYPFKPPNIVFLTKNGRFEVGTKICLSISAYHEESWQPAWGVRTMLEAIISFMPSEGMGAIGALDWTAEERKKLAIESKNYVCSLCGKASLLLSDPALDIPADSDPLTLAKHAADAAAMAESIAQLSLKPAKTPHSPHVHANHALGGDLPGVGMAMKSSNFASDMDVGPFSVQEGTSNFDMITTSVSAPPLEDSDGMADFLPDLDERMLEFDNNNLDAEDNFDCIGMMETLPRGSESNAGGGSGNGSGSGSGSGSVNSPTRDSDKTPTKEQENYKVSADCISTPATATSPLLDTNNETTTAVERDAATSDAAYPITPTSTSTSVLRNRKTHTDISAAGSADTHTTHSTHTTHTASDTHDHSTCCGGHSHTSSHSHDHTPTSTTGTSTNNTYTATTTTTTTTTTANTANTDANSLINTTELSEAERQVALQEIEQARAHLVHRLGSVDRALAAAVDRIQQAEERLAQNLEQMPQDNVQLGGVRAVRAGDGNNVNDANMNVNLVERDLVDEWLTVLLIALGTSIALMAWRIVLRYYTLFLL